MDKDIIILNELIITPLIKAKQALQNALSMEKTDITRDACIQRFEFTFELAWKTLKRVCRYQGIEVNNPRDVFREAAKQQLIDDPEKWFEFLKSRNLTSHTYDENKADMIYNMLPEFSQALDALENKLLSL